VLHLHLAGQVADRDAPVIFSSIGCRIPCAATIARDRVFAVWNVATTGASEVIAASIDRLGVNGSCTCTTSKSPTASQRPHPRGGQRPERERATEPL
jgi:hypothetical protein